MRVIRNMVAKIHAVLLSVTDGRIGGSWFGTDIGLLRTTGHITGQGRTTPVMVFYDGEDEVIAASANGSEVTPDWYLNLRSNPEVMITLHGKTEHRIAGVADGERRELLWNMIAAQEPRYIDYQRKTNRRIPVVVLRNPTQQGVS